MDAPQVEVAAGTGLALLVALAAASRVPRAEHPAKLARALDDVGDTEGESWLNVLGIPLDAGEPYDADRLSGALEALDPIELRRHLLGRFAWSWCTLAGVDDIELAAAGDHDAAGRLLAHGRYYGGNASRSLGVLLAVDPAETKRRLVAAVDAAAARLLLDASAAEELDAAARAARETLAEKPGLGAIERLALGYRYVPEVEATRVVLVPHLEPDLSLILAQHRSARVIAYRVTPSRGTEARVLGLGKALADPKRVEILGLVSRGVGRAPDLVEATGLTRSTVHHHLALLRDAGLVALEGNARAYTYVPRRAAAADAAALVADLIGTEEE